MASVSNKKKSVSPAGQMALDDIRLFFASVNGNFFNSRSNVQSQPTHLRPLMQTTFLTLSEEHQLSACGLSLAPCFFSAKHSIGLDFQNFAMGAVHHHRNCRPDTADSLFHSHGVRLLEDS
jgi:hypothetical protein